MTTWTEAHERSEALAHRAYEAQKTGKTGQAALLYQQAAKAETEALDLLLDLQPRTYAITAVSAASLYLKGGDPAAARALAEKALASESLPAWAERQLREFL